MLTKVQKKRLAREARKLAMECLTNGPEMRRHWCGCAIGLSLKRAGLWADPPDASGGPSAQLACKLEADFSGCTELDADRMYSSLPILGTAARERIDHDNPTAVVFPLLAWADFLEESSEQPRAAPSKDF